MREESTQNITQQEIANPEVVGENYEDVSVDLRDGNPFKDVSLDDVLSRQYLLTSKLWVPGVTDYINVGYDLLHVPQIVAKLSYFKYIRFGIRIHIRLNASPFVYGKIAFGWLPPMDQTTLLTYLDAWSYARPKLLSASGEQDLTFEVGWNLPDTWLDLSTQSALLPPLGWLLIREATPLRVANDTVEPAVQLRIFAELIDVQLAGFRPVAQSNPSKGGKWKPREVTDPVHKEAEEKSEKGIISGVLRAANTLAPLLYPIPEVGEVAMLAGPIAGALAPIFEAYGYEKPMSLVANTPVASRMYDDFVQGSGLSHGARASLDPDQSLLSGVVPEACNDVREIAMRPSLVGAFNFTDVAAIGAILFTTELDFPLALGQRPAYDAYIARTFMFFRGSRKFRFEFVCSKFFTTRVQIAYIPGPDAYNALTNYGDVVSTTVDIRGDASVDFVVPWLYRQPWMYTGASAGKIVVTMINPIIGMDPSLDNTIDCLVWRSVGEDAQFSCLTAQFFPVAESDTWQDFGHVFSPIGGVGKAFVESSWVADEQVYAINTILKRKVCLGVIPVNGVHFDPWGVFYSQPMTTPGVDFHHVWKSLFFYFRGSVRLDIIPSNNFSTWMSRGFGGILPTAFANNTGASWEPEYVEMGFTSTEIPYYNAKPYHSYSGYGVNDPVIHGRFIAIPPNSVMPAFLMCRSYGEDLEMGYLLPPPKIGELHEPDGGEEATNWYPVPGWWRSPAEINLGKVLKKIEKLKTGGSPSLGA